MARFTQSSDGNGSGTPGPTGPQGDKGDPGSTEKISFHSNTQLDLSSYIINNQITVYKDLDYNPVINTPFMIRALSVDGVNPADGGAFLYGVVSETIDNQSMKIVIKEITDIFGSQNFNYWDYTIIGKTGLQGDPGSSADLESVFSETSYTVDGGSLGTQPTFNGTPLFSGSYTKTGNLVHFRVNVSMTNITNFGSGQYYVTIPFTSEYDVYVRNGQLKHSSGDMYSISGHALSGSNQLKLYTTASNGKEVAFTSSVPVGLNSSCDFHIFGSYFSTPNS